MIRLKRTVVIFSFSFLSLLFVSWGYSGHRKINRWTTLSFPAAMSAFTAWQDSLAAHASDADARKSWDPDESPRHYIDLEEYPCFLTEGRLPSTYDSALYLYGNSFLTDNGFLPWATRITYDSLVAAFARYDWHAAILFASDLGHYVADGHMPLHLTSNYDGQLTGQDGIHSRYESDMIYYFLNQIYISGGTVQQQPDIQQYILGYIYENHTLKDSVLLADSLARAEAGSNSSYYYYTILWQYTSGFTKTMFNKASLRLAELIYNAWLEAGSPGFYASLTDNAADIRAVVFPNPVNGIACMEFTLPRATQLQLVVTDITGRAVMSFPSGEYSPGRHRIQFDTSLFKPGAYFCIIITGEGVYYTRFFSGEN